MPQSTLQDTIASALGVGPVPKRKPVWELIQEIDEFVDYEYYVPDVNQHGLRLRLTLNLDDQTATLCLIGDNEDGDRLFEFCDIPIPWDYALQVTNYPLEEFTF